MLSNSLGEIIVNSLIGLLFVEFKKTRVKPAFFGID